MADINYITGASGFVGSHLVKKLDNVVAIPHTEISTFKLQPFKNFYFLSSYGNMFEQRNINKTIQANLLDLINIINQAVKYKFESFIFVSTSSVTLPEQTLYSRTKLAAEGILIEYMERMNLPISIVRPFTIVGVGQQPQHLIPTLIRSCMTGKQMPFVSSPTHDYISIDDVVRNIILLSSHHMRGIYPLGTGVPHSNQDVLELVEGATGKKANVEIVPTLRKYDSNHWVSKEKAFFGFTKTLKDSILEMVKDYEQKTKNFRNK